MTDPSSSSVSKRHLPPEPLPSPPPAPRWVRVFGVLGLVLLVAFVVLHATGRGLGHLH
jgi:hypothetical protein